MRNNRNQNTSAVPGKHRAMEQPEEKTSRRPEGTVHEHKVRVKRNSDKHSENTKRH